ncbi:MAG: glycoside hydrolase family 3 N-terminal domain-containing protein [Anaerolineaceae bacterium]
MKTRTVLAVCLVMALLGGLIPGIAQANPSEQSIQAANLLAQMSPAEKVGQLFLVTFDGSDVSPTSELYDLITNRHIGGFVLRADHDNFVDPDAVSSAYDLIATMQTQAWEKTQQQPESTITGEPPVYVPLYIGIEQSGGGGSSDQIISGLTPLPNQMTLGATWSPALAQEVGEVMGADLAALGFNLYLGPSLDVVDTSSLETAGYAGTQTYGGDPYWVGELGKSYVNGLHTGSLGRMSVIARHFPGLGGADRPPTEEVATVRKSLEQLKQIELAPYIAVTSSEDPAAQVDGLMISHIRFQGFQGNIRATTRPVSFDSTDLEQLLAVEPLAAWRDAGGLTVSDNLGSRAVRLFFDSTGSSFDATNIARTAFLAGNDMLYLNDFVGTGDESSYETILHTLDFFSQKYVEDSLFAQRVDAAVLRILNAKTELYGEFTLEHVLPNKDELSNVGTSTQVNFGVAREAVTLISPSSDYLNTLLPSPPSTYEYMVIFTDQRTQTQCSSCATAYGLSVKAFQDSLLDLYGPSGSNQILQSRLSSYSFAQLIEVLDKKTEPTDPYLADNLKRATWVIFNIQDLDPNVPESYALRRILSERLDLLRDKKVIVFAYDAPYYLDATEISKLTAYYGLFSKNQGFVDVAARVLMQETQANGSLPVSLAAVGYDLIAETAPDPNQVIPITLVTPIDLTTSEPSAAQTPSPTAEAPVPLFRLGETVKIQAGIIRDHNQHLVPDGTVVRFTIRLAGDELIIAQPEAVTQGGFATIEYRIEREGIFEVTASSEPANTSGTLILNTQGGLAQLIMPTPTATSSPTPTLTSTRVVETTPEPTREGSNNQAGYPDMQDWLLMLMVLMLGFGLTFLVGRFWWGTSRWGLRSGLCSLIGGLVAYLLLTLGVPSLQQLVLEGGTWFVIQMAMVGILFGWIAALIWWMSSNTPHFPSNKNS